MCLYYSYSLIIVLIIDFHKMPPHKCNLHQHYRQTVFATSLFLHFVWSTDLFLQFTLASHSYTLHVMTQFNNCTCKNTVIPMARVNGLMDWCSEGPWQWKEKPCTQPKALFVPEPSVTIWGTAGISRPERCRGIMGQSETCPFPKSSVNKTEPSTILGPCTHVLWG